jgi:hypothetical protein
MLSSKTACEIARKLPDVSEKGHFGSDAFYANKRIFATVWHDKQQVNVRLSPEQQQAFIRRKPDAFFQIDNAWGRQGWTSIGLADVDRALFKAAIETAWENAVTRSSRPARSRKSRPKTRRAS